MLINIACFVPFKICFEGFNVVISELMGRVHRGARENPIKSRQCDRQPIYSNVKK